MGIEKSHSPEYIANDELNITVGPLSLKSIDDFKKHFDVEKQLYSDKVNLNGLVVKRRDTSLVRAIRNFGDDESCMRILEAIGNTGDAQIKKVASINDNNSYLGSSYDVKYKNSYKQMASYIYYSLIMLNVMHVAHMAGGIDGVKHMLDYWSTDYPSRYEDVESLKKLVTGFTEKVQNFITNNGDTDVVKKFIKSKENTSFFTILDETDKSDDFVSSLGEIITKHKSSENKPKKTEDNKSKPYDISTDGYNATQYSWDPQMKKKMDASIESDKKNLDTLNKEVSERNNRKQDSTGRDNRSGGPSSPTQSQKPSQPFYGQRQESTYTFVGSSDTNRRISAPTTTVEQTNTLTPDMRRLYNDIVSGLNTISIDKLYMSYRRLQGLKSKLGATDQSRYSQTIGSLQAAIRTKVDSYIDDISSYDDNRQYQSQSIQRPQIESLLASYLSSYEPGNLDDDKRMITNLYVSLK